MALDEDKARETDTNHTKRGPDRRVSPAVTEWQTFVEPLQAKIKELEAEIERLKAKEEDHE